MPPTATPWEARSVKVGFDATPLLGPRTGIGTYTEKLVQALVATTTDLGLLELVATPFSWRGTEPLRGQLPGAVQISARRVPARALRALWGRTGWPPVELLSGRVDVFHGTNFLAPPTRRAGTVVTVHDLAYLELPETVSAASLAYRHLVPAALARGAVVCAVTEAMGATIREAYALPEERVVVTPLGVDDSWFSVTRRSSPPSLGLPAQYVVAVGTLEPRKNLAVLLEAYRLAAATPGPRRGPGVG
jgi:glycosyltransferase involved in cell wall biosynthesis